MVKTFEQAVAEKIRMGFTRGEALRESLTENPGLYRQYLLRLSKIKGLERAERTSS